MRILVIIFEILYYSLFMKFSRKEGKFWKYILLFTFIQLFFFFVTSNFFISYMLLILMILFGIKYVIKIETSLYDMMIIFIMLLFKLMIEFVFALTLPLLIENINVCKLILGFIKIIILLIIGRKMNPLYSKLKIMWNNNNFYIRYSFTVFMFLYVIFTCIFLIKMS